MIHFPLYAEESGDKRGRGVRVEFNVTSGADMKLDCGFVASYRSQNSTRISISNCCTERNGQTGDQYALLIYIYPYSM
jgi:hypothetical protein